MRGVGRGALSERPDGRVHVVTSWMLVGATESVVGVLREGGAGSVAAGLAWGVVGLALAWRAGGGRVLRSPWLAPLAYGLASVLVALDLRGVALILAGVGALALLRSALHGLARLPRLAPLATLAAVPATLAGLAARDGLPAGLPPALSMTGGPDTARAAPLPEVPDPDAPDVLLLTVDTLRADATGETFDALADRGLSGPAWSTAPWTLPALASLHTGLTPYGHGALVRPPVAGKTRIAGFDAPTLAERYAAAGYATAAFVENPHVTRARGFGRGFHTWDSPDDRAPPRALLLDPFGLGADLRPLVTKGRDPEARVDAALAWLEAQDRPAFVWVHLLGPHLPWHGADTSPGTALHDALGDAPTRLNLDHVRRGSLRWTPALRAEVRAAYLAEAKRADAALGRLVAAAPDAVMVYTADHGEELGEHGGWEHGHALWEEVVRVPFAMAGPGIGRGTFGSASLVDVSATLGALHGWQAANSDGVDLRAGVGVAFLQDTLYLEEREGVVAWPWKLTRTLAGDEVRLFDLSADPGETRDLAADRPEVVTRLAGMLDAERLRLGETPTGTIDAKLRALGYVE